MHRHEKRFFMDLCTSALAGNISLQTDTAQSFLQDMAPLEVSWSSTWRCGMKTISPSARLRTFLCATAFAAVVALGSANAQAPEDLVELVEKADIDGDGNIAWSEVLSSRENAFGRLDRNGDGIIDSNDRPRIGRDKFDSAFEKVSRTSDANGDGSVSRTEMMDAPSPIFVAGDIDGDKVLTAEELNALRTNGSNDH
jgi:Ca2+-binding EF-hand superfamily protein